MKRGRREIRGYCCLCLFGLWPAAVAWSWTGNGDRLGGWEAGPSFKLQASGFTPQPRTSSACTLFPLMQHRRGLGNPTSMSKQGAYQRFNDFLYFWGENSKIKSISRANRAPYPQRGNFGIAGELSRHLSLYLSGHEGITIG